VATLAGQYGPVGYEYPNGQHAANVPYRVTTTLGADILLYANKTKIVSKPNPGTTDQYGNISFFANPGEYNLIVSDGAPVLITVPLHPDEPISGGGGGELNTEQIIIPTVAGSTLSGHRLVVPYPDGSVKYADPTNIAHLHLPIWMTQGAATAGQEIDVLAYGVADEPSWNWSPGPLYLGAAGTLTRTPPVAPAVAFLAQVGSATGTQRIMLDRFPSIALVS
jgi:hypothetical protein